jgi:hypothetical protein
MTRSTRYVIAMLAIIAVAAVVVQLTLLMRPHDTSRPIDPDGPNPTQTKAPVRQQG